MPQLQLRNSKLLIAAGGKLAVAANCCAACNPFPGHACNCAGGIPSQLKVVISGVVTRNPIRPPPNQDCADCSPVNGIYIVSVNPNPGVTCNGGCQCNWCVDFSAICDALTALSVCFSDCGGVRAIDVSTGPNHCNGYNDITDISFHLDDPPTNCNSYVDLDIPLDQAFGTCDNTGATCKITAL